MYRLISLCCLLGAVFGRQPAAPQHRADLLPDTEFSCRDKVLGGYYADPDAQCQMFHVCVKVAGVGIQDFRFLCPNGTAFDQEAQICAGWEDVACEPAALYYSSDNFDLYRIGSGFESKKAPTTFEDEPDFHLQRAESDILSGAHSSNFFNNREGKDNQDAQETGGQTKNQVDQPQRKKIVRKLQRRPTESAPRAAPTTARQFTNNFAGSYGSTTSRTSVSTTPRTTSQAPQNNDNYNNYNSQRVSNYQQSYRQPSSTSAPVYDQNKFTKATPEPVSVKTEQTTAQNKNNRGAFKSRQQTTSDYKYTDNNQQYKNSQPSSTVDYNNYNNGGNQQYERKQQQPSDYSNYNTNQESAPRLNKERKQQTYQNQQSTTKVNYGSDVSVQFNDQKVSPQYNNNNGNKNTPQQTTPKYNYNGENDQKYNNQDYASKIPFAAKTTQQSTPQYNQQYNNQQSSQSNYNAENVQAFDKIKSTTKYSEKKQQFNNNKQSTPEYNNYNADNRQYNGNQQQTPAPKYNTNLQYDNNQQSTPNYYSADYNQQYKTSQAPSSTYQQQQYSTASSSVADYNANQYQQKSSSDYQQYSTARPAPSSSAVTYNNDNQQAYEQKSTAGQQYSTSRQPANNQQFRQKATPAPFKSNIPADYDDGQYRPEVHEREAGGEYDVTVRQSSRQEALFEVTQEPELLKAAHSINIAASKNQLARENARAQIYVSPSSTAAPVIQTPKPTTQAPPRSIVTTSAPARSVYANFAAVTSSAPRPFSLRPAQSSVEPQPQKQVQVKAPQSSAAPPTQQQPKQIQSKAASPVNEKPISSKKGKDVSYDYAYYDNADHYSEYENIEEFGRTSKKQ